MDRSRVLDQDEVEKFIASLSNYQPAIPDELVRYYLSRAGFVTDDIRVERLIAVAAQKFLADVANDAIANCRLRAAATPVSGSRSKAAARDPKLILTVDDLERALREYGVNLRKPPYFADSISAGLPEAQAQQQSAVAQPQTSTQHPQQPHGGGSPVKAQPTAVHAESPKLSGSQNPAPKPSAAGGAGAGRKPGK